LFYAVLPNKGKRKNQLKADKYVLLLSDFEDLILINDAYFRDGISCHSLCLMPFNWFDMLKNKEIQSLFETL